ncbi:TlpA family protein disulfide reductase [Streptomyces nigra]|uniref:TlpA family protein disulfide reductase n=1 Tax=Streptomyces nigra TaxID=1827580 RepID=UPI0036C4F645
MRSRMLMLAASLLVAGCSGGDADGGFTLGEDGIATVAKEDRDLAPDLSGRTLHGERLSVASHRGEVVVLNVWGSWCTPCRKEAPHFEKVHEELKSQGVRFVGINVGDPRSAHARAFEKEFGVTYPSLHDPTSKLMLRFEKGTLSPTTIPSTLVLDRDGRIAARSLAALGEDGLRRMITPVLAEG